jgi:electron transfer flavoprotein alpha/beta subunit
LRIVPLVKQVIDVDQVKTEADGTVKTDGVPFKISNYDKNAVEAAVRIKEKNPGTEVVALATGPNIKEGVKEVLAMGCDKAVIVSLSEFKGGDTLANSRVLAAAIKKIGEVDLIIGGEGSLDSYSGFMGPRLSQRLDLPLVSYAVGIEVAGKTAKIKSNVAGILEDFEVPMPCIVTVSEEINQPRLPPLLQILQAGKKPMQEYKLADLGLKPEDVGAAGSGLKILKNQAPKMERKRVRIKGTPEESAAQLVQALRKEGVI